MDPVPEIIDTVFTKTSPNRSFCMTENERFLHGPTFTVKHLLHFTRHINTERIEWFIEDKAFLRSFDSAPRPPPVSKLSLSLSLPMCRRSSLLTGEWWGGGGGARKKRRQKSLCR